MISVRRARFCLTLIFLMGVSLLRAETTTLSLSQRIDKAIVSAHVGPVSKRSTDAEFVRRIYLDLIGRGPTRAECEKFFADQDSGKRAVLIDRLLECEEFDEYFSRVLDVVLMERRSGTRIPQADWLAFLKRAVSEKWAYDRIIQEVITADGRGTSRAAAKFLMERDVESNALTRDLGRIFLGRDLQCAQCHDHPNIMDYEQSEYYGILSFVDRSYLFEDEADNKKPYVGEKAEGELEYKSVFLPDDDPARSRPHLLSGLTLDVEPRFDGGNAYLVAPSKQAAALPKFSRRAELARLITHPANEFFAKNSVNRFWKHLMGIGIVDPVDFHHSDNPPSHPALLEMLAGEFVASDFDLRGFLRQVANTDAYQRAVDYPTEVEWSLDDLTQRIEQCDQEIETLSGKPTQSQAGKYRTRLEKFRQRVELLDEQIDATAKSLNSLEKQRAEADEVTKKLRKQTSTHESQLASLNQAVVAASQVAETIPKDKQLAKVVKQYQERVTKSEQELTATQQKLSESEKKLNELSMKTLEARQTLGRMHGKRIGMLDMVAEARGALGVAEETERQRLAALNGRKQYRIILAQQQAEVELFTSLRETTQQISKLENEKRTLLEKKQVAVTQSLGQLEQQVTQQRIEIAGLQELREEIRASVEKTESALGALMEAISKAAVVDASISDLGVDEAIAALNVSRQTLRTRRDDEKQALAESAQRVDAALKNLAAQSQERERLVKRQARIGQDLADLESRLKLARVEMDQVGEKAEQARERVRRAWERRFAMRALVPLSPEQLAGATISALELMPRFEREAQGELEKTKEKSKGKGLSQAEEDELLASLAQKRIDTVRSTYVSMFAAPGGAPQDVFSATADQALFFANDGRVQGWLSAAKGTLIAALEKSSDDTELARQLYLALLVRSPTPDEIAEVGAYLQQRSDDRNKAIRELVWGLLTSLEFRFNH